MFCPSCRAEYREGFSRCSDCDVALVEALAPERARKEFELEKVLETSNPALLAIAKAVLDGAGIEYFVSGEGSQIDTVIPVRVEVPEDRAAEARALLEELEDSELAPPEDEDD